MLTSEDVKQQERIQRCLRSDDGREFLSKINDLCHRATMQLKSAREVIDIHRYQGRIEAYEQILKMKED